MSEAPMNQLTEQEKADGWQLLFDGESTGHWRGFRSESFPDGWVVVDGTLHRADKAGDIITKEQFQDLEFSIEWKVAGPGNSGLFFRVSEDEEQVWKTGPEYQILNNDVHPDGQNPKTQASANYALHAPTKDMCKPVGEWNHSKILVDGNHVEHWLNGEKVVEYELFSDDWEKRVAESKFSKFPRYGREPEGHLALQDHNDPVWYRNIKVRPLNG
jgi:hypothetical protein